MDNVICLESEALEKLVELLYEKYQEKHGAAEDEWCNLSEAMRILRVTSKSTMQKLRDEEKIVFTQPSKRLILYKRSSLYEYLERSII